MAMQSLKGDTQYHTSGDIQPFPDYVNSAAIAAGGAAEAITIPSGAIAVRLSANGPVYVNANATAVVPTDITDGSASYCLNLGEEYLFSLEGVTSLSVISDAGGGTIVTAGFYS